MSTGTIITWDGNPSSAVEELVVHVVERNLVGSVQDEIIEMPGSIDGGWVVGDRRGFRTITAEFYIIEKSLTDRSSRVSELGTWLDKTGIRTLKFSDQPDRYWEAYLAQAPSVDEWKARGQGVFRWQARPYAYAVELSEICVTATAGSDSGTLTIPDGLPACPVVEITPLDGPISVYTLGVGTDELVVSGGIGSGNTQTVSGCSYTITGGVNAEAELNGAYVATPQWTVDADGQFPAFDGGNTPWTFDWSGAATNVQLCFYWRRRYT